MSIVIRVLLEAIFKTTLIFWPFFEKSAAKSLNDTLSFWFYSVCFDLLKLRNNIVLLTKSLPFQHLRQQVAFFRIICRFYQRRISKPNLSFSNYQIFCFELTQTFTNFATFVSEKSCPTYGNDFQFSVLLVIHKTKHKKWKIVSIFVKNIQMVRCLNYLPSEKGLSFEFKS